MKILILTGAGISAESGLPTFRGRGGLWRGHRVEDVATAEAFERNPGLVLDFYNQRRSDARKAKPNAAHLAIARLQASAHKVIVATQNIDDLHERAGSHKVAHLHGSIFEARCNACWRTWSASYDMEPEDVCPLCGESAVRPNVVMFGEAPMAQKLVNRALQKADLFVAIGTSGTVFPAAELVKTAKALRVPTHEFNIAQTAVSVDFDARSHGPACETVPAWVDALRGDGASPRNTRPAGRV